MIQYIQISRVFERPYLALHNLNISNLGLSPSRARVSCLVRSLCPPLPLTRDWDEHMQRTLERRGQSEARIFTATHRHLLWSYPIYIYIYIATLLCASKRTRATIWKIRGTNPFFSPTHAQPRARGPATYTRHCKGGKNNTGRLDTG